MKNEFMTSTIAIAKTVSTGLIGAGMVDYSHVLSVPLAMVVNSDYLPIIDAFTKLVIASTTLVVAIKQGRETRRYYKSKKDKENENK
jgi:hypothetical protein